VNDENPSAQGPDGNAAEQQQGDVWRAVANGAGELVRDVASSAFQTALFYLTMALALVSPISGLILGALFLWRAIATGREEPSLAMAIVLLVLVWIMAQSPLGFLPLLLSLRGWRRAWSTRDIGWRNCASATRCATPIIYIMSSSSLRIATDESSVSCVPLPAR
jgi:hypothetical protein